MSYVEANRAHWTSRHDFQLETARRNWAAEELTWGLWKVPEAELQTLPDVAGLDVVELGCGTAYWSAWLARRGAHPVAVDVTPTQLEIARAMRREHGLDFPLVEADAEATGLRGASFDLAFSEYGASIWCDPYRWIPEAARLLRPGGRLVFMKNGLIAILCAPPGEDDKLTAELLNDYHGMHRFDWPEGTTEFHLGHGDMIRLLRRSGFELEQLVEVQAPEGAETNPSTTT